MDLNDILEIEQSKYCYEQAYALHRHKEIPALFLKSEGTTFDIAGDAISGWDAVNRKFCEELFYVSSAEDSYHTGWQISMPLIYEDPVSEIWFSTWIRRRRSSLIRFCLHLRCGMIVSPVLTAHGRSGI